MHLSQKIIFIVNQRVLVKNLNFSRKVLDGYYLNWKCVRKGGQEGGFLEDVEGS